MTAIGVSSGIFRDIFSTELMRRIFADENRIQKYLDIEAALALGAGAWGSFRRTPAMKFCAIARSRNTTSPC